jgi:surface antigen
MITRGISRCFAFAWPLALLTLAACQSAGMRINEPLAYAPANDGSVGVIGSQIARGIADDDRKIGLSAEYRALEYGESGVGVEWQGHNSVAGVVVPGPRYRVNDYDCRQFNHTIVFHEATESARATACRGVDGAWRIVG